MVTLNSTKNKGTVTRAGSAASAQGNALTKGRLMNCMLVNTKSITAGITSSHDTALDVRKAPARETSQNANWRPAHVTSLPGPHGDTVAARLNLWRRAKPRIRPG